MRKTEGRRIEDTSPTPTSAKDEVCAQDSRRMNIGVYVRTLAERSPASTRFQEAILEGLKEIRSDSFRFTVLSEEIPDGYEDAPGISYVRVRRPTTREIHARRRKLLLGGLARRLLRLAGAQRSSAYVSVTRWMAYEPTYYQQLRELNVRLIWNLGVDFLPSFLPFAMVVWDCNYRIYPMFPEYSYLTDGYRFFDQITPMLHTASYVIVGTEQGRREVVDIFGVYEDKVRVIPFPTPQLSPDPGENSQAEPYLFYPARFWPHKNHIVLVRALKLLRDERQLKIRCVLSGIDNGNLGYVLREAERLGVRDQIEYLGNVPVGKLAQLYRDAMALVYCSAVGPDNFPPLEAMSLGCPVIAAEVSAAREQYGDAVLPFDPMSEEQLAQRIGQLLDDASLRATLVERGAARAARWRPNDYAHAMVGVLEEFARLARTWEGAGFKASLA
jgi:glycosyltransferase involved in cell wall biosynthesis